MQRQFRFRFWSLAEKKMSSTYSIADLVYEGFPPEYVNEHGDVLTSDGVVMQSTNLLDKNGKEIYEGDIIARHAMKNTFVEYHDGQWVLRREDKDAVWREELAKKLKIHLEIIGNIYENPELL